ncbi:hypothetical protein [Fodinicurvata halophila]|uniref:hypothetical protein n=1 Tax=Fodinicurvata halophila TaxID=1419723 RepID=UPI00362E1D32
MPVKWCVSGFRDAVGETAEEAIAVARRITNERERNARAARRQADHAGLPALQGSARQVQWAEQIRAICRDRDLVKEATRRRVKTAKYWIDHFKHVTRK